MYKIEERKPIPRTFLDPKLVENVIHPEIFGALVEDIISEEEEIRERQRLCIILDNFIARQSRLIRIKEYVKVVIWQEKPIKPPKPKVIPLRVNAKRCSIPDCPNMARESYFTCSPICTIKQQYGWYAEGGFHTISDEEAAKKLRKRDKIKV